ncbi:MAG: ATP-binding protein [Opitutales bacterium]
MSELGDLSFDFAEDDALTGFRLQRLEVFNWGTFDQRVWTIEPEGRNCLLTGDIGSGKSTLVDAVTTLLVPSHRVAYNKAAGADFKERSLRSYVLGYYRSERNETTGVGRPVGLRDANSYSVVLGVFCNTGFEQTVTLAAVFWMKDALGQPARFFVASERALSIAGDFSNFGSDITQLRKKLRSGGGEVFDSFPPYGAWFRRRFGIDNEQALDLFHQTVSMKSVGNLTEFVRGHMLEPFEVAPRITALIRHFDDLTRAHEAVLKAKRQIEKLGPLVADAAQHTRLSEEVAGLRECREWLRPYFASLKLELLNKRLKLLAEDWERQNRQVGHLEERLRGLNAEADELKRNIAENGGDRLERLALEIDRLTGERSRRREKANRYGELVRAIDEPPPGDEAQFQAQYRRLAEMTTDAASREADLQNRITEESVSLRQGTEEHHQLSAEIESLKARRSNIPSSQVAIRSALCEALAAPEEDMPFVGELLQVREEERDWEGAAERLLRNFGLSLLVPDEHYARVSDWVDRTHLRGRLVYFRIRPGKAADGVDLHPDSLVRKLSIKPESPCYDWLERELVHRFDVACCQTQEEFRRQTRAISRAGQIKMPGERHEKDDRNRLDDRSRYVLGWTNAAKIAALESNLRQLEERLAGVGKRISEAQAEKRLLDERLRTLSRLEEFSDYREIDWQTPAVEIDRLSEERRRLESASDVLRQLTERQKQVNVQAGEVEAELKGKREELGGIKSRKESAQSQRAEICDELGDAVLAGLAKRSAELGTMRGEALGEHQITVESCDRRERETREWLQSRIDVKDKALSTLREKIVVAMRAYCSEFPLDTQEVDISVEAADEYRGMLERLQADDLPQFEARFKDLLNVNTIREIANFNVQLSRERESIKERISRINESLAEIDYNAGRYILLEAQAAPDVDIREFQSELRACTEGALTGSEDSQYSETKFLQVKRIIERFRGREGLAELDKRWTQKVTDVRNWFVFAASERWREDDTEYEHYSDSGGKSGGQKEKLAYTILAASLAYQFGLEWGKVRSRSFRFVVIDEAFGRGSDESAQFGLRLFEKLNLQLLIVTPLQKIHIIEPFVSTVGFVHNEEGRCSKLRCLTIEAYRAEKAKHTA